MNRFAYSKLFSSPCRFQITVNLLVGSDNSKSLFQLKHAAFRTRDHENILLN